GAGDIAESPDFISATTYAMSGLPAGANVYLRLYTQTAPGDLAHYIDITARTRTAAAPVCPCSLLSADSVPLHIETLDLASVTLGVRFQSERNGYITGIRFYKAAGSAGQHVGSLWTASGALLGT